MVQTKHKFKSGSQVQWSSHSRGNHVTKSGKVIAIVPAHANARSVAFNHKVDIDSHSEVATAVAKHDRYLVLVTHVAGKKLQHPMTYAPLCSVVDGTTRDRLRSGKAKAAKAKAKKPAKTKAAPKTSKRQTATTRAKAAKATAPIVTVSGGRITASAEQAILTNIEKQAKAKALPTAKAKPAKPASITSSFEKLGGKACHGPATKAAKLSFAKTKPAAHGKTATAKPAPAKATKAPAKKAA